jgi:outer membrane protein assembly factor BamB
MQDGRSSIHPSRSGGALWAFPTGNGIFSSPVIGSDGTVYVGSADTVFYAINPDGTLKWKFQTGGIIDSAALLDNKSRVYFGSGDGNLYALNAGTGQTVWKYLADDPSVNNAYIRWFESNVAIGPTGDLYAPNDNFFIYAIDRNTGQPVWKVKMGDQTWSLPAVDPSDGMLYGGNNNMVSLFGNNVFNVNESGKIQWSYFITGTVAASPLITTDGKMIVGAFDGYVYAFDTKTGTLLWRFGTRDHIYSSPALLPDGTVIQPSADGTVYALDPSNGKELWAFDTLMPIRSSPAIDADGNIYFGSGEGKLFVLNPNGTFRWSLQLINTGRNDLNSSPALGRNAVYIGGENGDLFSVPYDYCLRPAAANNPSCTVGSAGQEDGLPSDGAFLYYTTDLGNVLLTPPTVINANQVLTFSLFVRQNKQTQTAVLDSSDFIVSVSPSVPLNVNISGDRKFITIAPVNEFIPDSNGNATITISGSYLVNLGRTGLLFTGGTIGGTLSNSTFTFSIQAGQMTSTAFPMVVPAVPGDNAGVWEMYRLAAPRPTILPSYDQIGFDSLHFLIGIVSTCTTGYVGWVAGAMLSPGTNQTVIDPSTGVLYPVVISFDNGLVTMKNEDGVTFEIYDVKVPFNTFELATSIDSTGNTYDTPQVAVTTDCNGIPFYGAFLQALGFCNPQTGLLTVSGAALLRPYNSGTQSAPSGFGSVGFTVSSGQVIADISGSTLQLSAHSFGILLIDPATGLPVSLSYGTQTARTADASGNITRAALTYDPAKLPAGHQATAYIMVDTYPAARSPVLTLP